MHNNSLSLTLEQLTGIRQFIDALEDEAFCQIVVSDIQNRIKMAEIALNSFLKNKPVRLKLGMTELSALQSFVTEFTQIISIILQKDWDEMREIIPSLKDIISKFEESSSKLRKPESQKLEDFYHDLITRFEYSREGMSFKNTYDTWKTILGSQIATADYQQRIAEEAKLCEQLISEDYKLSNIFNAETLQVKPLSVASYIYLNPQRFDNCQKEMNAELTAIMRLCIISEWIAQDCPIIYKVENEDNDWASLEEDEKVKRAILQIQKEGLMKPQYDYAFVKYAIEEVTDNDFTNHDFINYLANTLQIDCNTNEESIKKMYPNIDGSYKTQYSFKDTSRKISIDHRTAIMKRFIAIFRKGI